MSKQRKLVYGVGVNDADYVMQKFETDYSARYASGKYKQKLVWVCPFYRKWRDMLQRCYSDKHQEKYPNYKDCIVSEEWKLFSNFRKWMVEQDWEGMQLDKDVLIVDNKVYSSETCVFVTSQVNSFMNDYSNARGEWPIGVHLDKKIGRFVTQCSNPFTGKKEWLGYYDCPQEAHLVWLKRKLEMAHQLAEIQPDPRVAQALIARYTDYTQTKGECNV